MNDDTVDECRQDLFEIKQEPVEDENINDIKLFDVEGNKNDIKQDLIEIGDCKISRDENTLDYKSNFVKVKSDEYDTEHDLPTVVEKNTKDTAIDDQKIYNCSNCTYTSNSKHYYTLHLKKHDTFLVNVQSGKTFFKCNYCVYKSKYKSNIRRHIKHLHEKDNDKDQTNLDYKIENIASYSEKGNDRCGEMNVKIKEGYSRKICSDQILSCMYCTYKTNKKRYLMRHLKGQNGERRCKKYVCSECPYVTDNSQHFNKHYAKHLLGSDKILQCSQCDYRTKYLSTLKIHVENKHGDVKSFKCPKCDYRSSFKANIKKHLPKHDNIRAYKCDRCSSSFKDKLHLNRHGIVHSEERNFHCAHCDYKSKRKAHLIVHLKDKHIRRENKEYKCPDCPYQTNRNTMLKKHICGYHNVAK